MAEGQYISQKTKPAPSNFYGDSKWQAEQETTGTV